MSDEEDLAEEMRERLDTARRDAERLEGETVSQLVAAFRFRLAARERAFQWQVLDQLVLDLLLTYAEPERPNVLIRHLQRVRERAIEHHLVSEAGK